MKKSLYKNSFDVTRRIVCEKTFSVLKTNYIELMYIKISDKYSRRKEFPMLNGLMFAGNYSEIALCAV